MTHGPDVDVAYERERDRECLTIPTSSLRLNESSRQKPDLLSIQC
jgi:hypothetical protein